MAIARGSLSFHISRSYASSTVTSQNIAILKKEISKNSSAPYEDEKKSFDSIPENDFEEKFIRGSGPGGQKVNKTSNCVELRHKPTGIVVKCHETRSQEKNRAIARLKIIDKLKLMFTPKESNVQMKMDEKKKKQKDSVRRRRLKEEAINSKVDID